MFTEAQQPSPLDLRLSQLKPREQQDLWRLAEIDSALRSFHFRNRRAIPPEGFSVHLASQNFIPKAFNHSKDLGFHRYVVDDPLRMPVTWLEITDALAESESNVRRFIMSLQKRITNLGSGTAAEALREKTARVKVTKFSDEEVGRLPTLVLDNHKSVIATCLIQADRLYMDGINPSLAYAFAQRAQEVAEIARLPMDETQLKEIKKAHFKNILEEKAVAAQIGITSGGEIHTLMFDLNEAARTSLEVGVPIPLSKTMMDRAMDAAIKEIRRTLIGLIKEPAGFSLFYKNGLEQDALYESLLLWAQALNLNIEKEAAELRWMYQKAEELARTPLWRRPAVRIMQRYRSTHPKS